MPARRSVRLALLALICSLAFGTAPALATPPTPSFSAKTDYSSVAGGGHSPGRMAIADLNDDGCRDVVVANTGGTATVAVMLGVKSGANCTGALGSATALSVPNRPRDVKLGDLDGDGCLDIVSANDTSSISRFLNTKTSGACTGTFGAIATYTAYQRASGLALADLNGDGCLDVAVAAWNVGGGWENPSQVSVFLGNKSGGVCSGTFASYVNYSIGFNGQGPLAVAAGDLNADGCLDLVSANRRSFDRWSALLGIKSGASCTGTFSTGVLYQGTGKGEAEDVALVDLNRDGRLDLVGVTTGQADSPVMVRLGGDGSNGVAVGAFRTAAEYEAGSGTNPEVVGITDVNRDGFEDVVIGYFSATYVSVYVGNGDGTLQPRVDFNATGATTGLALADMNNDGAPDIIAANRTNPGSLSVFLNQGLAPTMRTLTVSSAGGGSGSISSSPGGITCGATCTASFADATSVTLTATADAGSTFTGWSGACTGTGTCTVSMTAARNVTATFATAPSTESRVAGASAPATTPAPVAGRLTLDLRALPLNTDSGAEARFTARWSAEGGAVSATSMTLDLPAGMRLEDSECATLRGGRIAIAIPALTSGETGSCAFTVTSATTRRIKLRAVAAGQTESADVRPRATSPRAWLRSAIDVLTTGAARSALTTTLDGYWAGSVSREDALAALRRDVLAIRTRQLAMERTVPLAPDSLRETAALTRRALTLSRKADLAFIAWLNGDDSARFDAIRYSDLASDAKRRLVTDLEQRGANPPSHWAI